MPTTVNQNNQYPYVCDTVKKGRIIRLDLTPDNFTIAGVTNTVTILDLEPWEYVKTVGIYVNEEFSGGAVATAVIDVHDADGNIAAAPQDVFTGTKENFYPVSVQNGFATTKFNSAIQNTLEATLTTTVANIDKLTQGIAWVFVETGVIPENLRS